MRTYSGISGYSQAKLECLSDNSVDNKPPRSYKYFNQKLPPFFKGGAGGDFNGAAKIMKVPTAQVEIF